MQRYCAEYTIKVKVYDVMITSDETDIEIKEKIKKVGQDKLFEWVSGTILDTENEVFIEDVKITDKGL
jgi:hypothetical protein